MQEVWTTPWRKGYMKAKTEKNPTHRRCRDRERLGKMGVPRKEPVRD
jgi:hypothetical protein